MNEVGKGVCRKTVLKLQMNDEDGDRREGIHKLFICFLEEPSIRIVSIFSPLLILEVILAEQGPTAEKLCCKHSLWELSA